MFTWPSFISLRMLVTTRRLPKMRFAPADIELAPGGTLSVPTGVRARIEPGWVLMLFPRSGLGFKYRLQLNNTVGVVDSDYFDALNEGHIFIKLHNAGDRPVRVSAGETLALDYACIGVACAGLCYFVMAALIKWFGSEKVLKYFPPVVTGPMVIAIGLCLSGSAVSSASTDWLVALVAILVVIVSNMWGKGIVRIVPILLGVASSFGVAACMGKIDFTALHDAAWIGLPVARENTIIAVFDNPDYTLIMSSIIAIMPIAFATIMEHIGDMCAISGTVGKMYLADPGLHRTLSGDGIATVLASLFGAPANTTYGENTGVLNITKVFDPRVIRLAAIFAILLSFCPKFAVLIGLMPAATIGGVSLILYGMISAVGVRNIVDACIDFTSTRNIIIAALILVIAIGVKYGANDSVAIGDIHFSGLALSAIVGILLNIVLPHRLDIDIEQYTN